MMNSEHNLTYEGGNSDPEIMNPDMAQNNPPDQVPPPAPTTPITPSNGHDLSNASPPAPGLKQESPIVAPSPPVSTTPTTPMNGQDPIQPSPPPSAAVHETTPVVAPSPPPVPTPPPPPTPPQPAAPVPTPGFVNGHHGNSIITVTVTKNKGDKVGLMLGESAGRLFVSKINPGGLMSQTNLQVGMQVLAINNQECTNLPLSQAASILTGAEGTVTIVAKQHQGHIYPPNPHPAHPPSPAVPPPAPAVQQENPFEDTVNGHGSITVSVNKGPGDKVGILLGERDGKLYVSKIVPGGLMSQTDLKVGMQVVKINSYECNDMPLQVAANVLKGAEGTVTILATYVYVPRQENPFEQPQQTNNHSVHSVPVTPDNPFDDGANYTIEEQPHMGPKDDWANGTMDNYPPPDEAVYHDEGPMDGVADGAYDDDIYADEPYNEANEAYDDPYADEPYPEAYDDPYANTPYAAGRHDPYGELDYNDNTLRQEDLHDIDMSNRDPENLHGGEYELESKDPKSKGWQAWAQKYGKTMAFLLSMACFAVVLAAIILVASSGGGNSDSDAPRTADGSLSPWGKRKDQEHKGNFVPPPLALETICTNENIQSQDGFDACAALCEPAQCCRFDPMAAPHMSCQRGHVQDCHTYHHYCERPPKAAIIPFQPPPFHIKDLCTAEKMHTAEGVTACARACQGGTCCRYPTTLTGLSCLRGNEQDCQVYHKYCEQPPPSEKEQHPNQGNANGNPEVIFAFVKPPADISEKCASSSVATAKGFEQCLDLCRSGTCCRFDAEREPNLSCRNEHPDDCPVYDQYCGGGSTNVPSTSTSTSGGETGISGNNPASATYVEKVCSDHSLATVEGFADCSQACDKHPCCWKKEFGTTCPAGTHCEPYAHCLAMEASDHLDVAIEVAINMKCTDSLVSTVEGRKECLLACSQATCCFGPSSGDCPHADDSFCNQYSACEKVSNPQENVPPAPAQLQQHCQKDNLNTLQGLAECDRSCQHAECCWKEDSSEQPSCTKTNPLCADYAPCFILEEGTIVETYPPVPEAPTTLKDLCALKDSQDETACDDACQPAECCWKTGHCIHDQHDACEAYMPCAVLLDDVVEAPANLADVCTKESLATAPGTAACESVCEPAACCWKTGACLSTHPFQCQGYVPCALLYSSEDTSISTPAPVAQAPNLLHETCSPKMVSNPDGEMLCADVCKPAECCWKTGACLKTQAGVCEGYVPCAILEPHSSGSSSSSSSTSSSTSTSEIADAPVSLGLACTKDKVSTPDGLDACMDACRPAECCYKSGSCLGTQAGKCEGYVPCAILMDGTISAAAPSNLADTCSAASIASEAGRSSCVTECVASECCWESGTCRSKQPEICEGYDPCTILNQNAPTEAPLPSAPSFLPDVCTPEKVQNVEGAILCEDACKEAECCWKSGSCLTTQAAQCEGYVTCAVLGSVDDSDANDIPLSNIPKIPTYLYTVCGSEIAGDEVHGHLCVNACERADCCWNEDSNAPCKSDPNCSDGYNICTHVNFDTIVPPTPAPVVTPAPVATPAPEPGTTTAPQPATTPAPAVDQGYTEEMIFDVCENHDNSIVNLCAKVCAPGDCCFDRNGDSGESCDDSFPCYKYSACGVLHDTDNYVETACASDDLSDCVAACGGSTCCFTNNIEKTCAETNPNMICSRYTACEKLYGV